MLIFEVSVMTILLDWDINIVPEAYDGNDFASLTVFMGVVFNTVVMIFIRLFQKD